MTRRVRTSLCTNLSDGLSVYLYFYINGWDLWSFFILQHWIKRWIRICHVGQRSETRYKLESQNQNSFPLEKCLFVPKALSQTMTPWYSKTELAPALEKDQQKRSHCTPLCLARHESRFRGVQSHFVAAKKLMHSSISYIYVCIYYIISNNQICLSMYVYKCMIQWWWICT